MSTLSKSFPNIRIHGALFLENELHRPPIVDARFNVTQNTAMKYRSTVRSIYHSILRF